MGAQYTPLPVPVPGPMTQLFVFSPDTVLPTMILTLVNAGPGNVTDVKIDMLPLILTDASCPAHNLLSGTLLDGDGAGEVSDDYQTDPTTGLQLAPDVLRTSPGFPAIAANSSGFVIFKHYSPAQIIVSVATDGQSKVWAFGRV